MSIPAMIQIVESAREEYRRLLRLSIVSEERIASQRFMAFLRDFLAWYHSEDAQSLQDRFELEAKRYAAEQQQAEMQRLVSTGKISPHPTSKNANPAGRAYGPEHFRLEIKTKEQAMELAEGLVKNYGFHPEGVLVGAMASAFLQLGKGVDDQRA